MSSIESEYRVDDLRLDSARRSERLSFVGLGIEKPLGHFTNCVSNYRDCTTVPVVDISKTHNIKSIDIDLNSEPTKQGNESRDLFAR